jgi:hypothetical protein
MQISTTTSGLIMDKISNTNYNQLQNSDQTLRLCIKSPKSKAIILSVVLVFLVSYYDELKSPFTSSITTSEKSIKTSLLSTNVEPKAAEIAWLLSFPNSGTSFTSALVRELTQTSTGSNYDEAKHPTPIFPEYQSGPFSLREHLPLPDNGYILTKTHCTRCRGEQKSINKTTEEFLIGCKTVKVKRDDKCNDYDPKIVKRAVHLFRNPFDNVVGRFHLEWKNKQKTGNTKYVEKYPYSKEGMPFI